MKNRPLLLDLLEWLAERARPYDEVMVAWRTSCPQLTIWEDALDAGLVVVNSAGRSGKIVSVTDAGKDLLRQHGRGPKASGRGT